MAKYEKASVQKFSFLLCSTGLGHVRTDSALFIGTHLGVAAAFCCS